MMGSRYIQLEFAPRLRVNDYDDIAPWYDLAMGDDFVRASFPIVANVAKQIVPHDGRRVRHVDLACGTGALLCAFARAFDSDSVGIDISRGQLQVASDKARALGLRASFRHEDVVQSVLPECDIVTMGCDALNHITSVKKWAVLFRRVYRALAPGGMFVFDVNSPRRILVDLNYPEVIVKERVTYLHCGLEARIQPGHVRRQMLMQVFAESAGTFSRHHALVEHLALAKAEILELLEAAGFSDRKVLPIARTMAQGHIFMKNRWFFVCKK